LNERYGRLIITAELEVVRNKNVVAVLVCQAKQQF